MSGVRKSFYLVYVSAPQPFFNRGTFVNLLKLAKFGGTSQQKMQFKNTRKAKKQYDLYSYINEIFVLVLMSTIALYLAIFLKEQLEVRRHIFYAGSFIAFD